MNSVWTDERNRFIISTVNAFVGAKTNKEWKSSTEAYDLFLSEKELLANTANIEKYDFL